VDPHLRHLHAYLVENSYIENLKDYNEKALPIFSRDVLKKLRSGDTSWEEMVPQEVAQLIRERKLFGYKPQS
jgi:nicotinic acid mononucleotide adenylyltransferase